MEIVSRLEATGSTTRIFLVDAVPDTIQAVLASQQHHLQPQLLAHVLNITEVEVFFTFFCFGRFLILLFQDVKKLSEVKEWPSAVDLALRLANVEDRNKPVVKTIVEQIKKRVEQMSNYLYRGNMINGPTKLFRPFNASKDDSFGLTKVRNHAAIKNSYFFRPL